MSTKKTETFSIGTRITQVGRDPEKQHGFVNGAIYRGSTVVFPTVSDIENNRAEFNYGTMGTPTIANLENAWSELAGAAGTVLSPPDLARLRWRCSLLSKLAIIC